MNQESFTRGVGITKTVQYLEGHNRPKGFKIPLIGLSTISQDPYTQERNQD